MTLHGYSPVLRAMLIAGVLALGLPGLLAADTTYSSDQSGAPGAAGTAGTDGTIGANGTDATGRDSLPATSGYDGTAGGAGADGTSGTSPDLFPAPGNYIFGPGSYTITGGQGGDGGSGATGGDGGRGGAGVGARYGAPGGAGGGGGNGGNGGNGAAALPLYSGVTLSIYGGQFTGGAGGNGNDGGNGGAGGQGGEGDGRGGGQGGVGGDAGNGAGGGNGGNGAAALVIDGATVSIYGGLFTGGSAGLGGNGGASGAPGQGGFGSGGYASGGSAPEHGGDYGSPGYSAPALDVLGGDVRIFGGTFASASFGGSFIPPPIYISGGKVTFYYSMLDQLTDYGFGNYNVSLTFADSFATTFDFYAASPENFAFVEAAPTVAVPEPATYAALSGLLTLGYAMIRRRAKRA